MLGDELQEFLEKLYFRLLNDEAQIEKGKLNRAWVAFEALGAILPVLEAGLPHKEARAAYPFPHWRDETVEVPIAALKAIIDGWNKYLDSEAKTLGQAFGFEHLNRQGKQNMKKVSAQIDHWRALANKVETQYRRIGDEPGEALERIVSEIAEMEDLSARTVERAYQQFRDEIDRNIRNLEARRRITHTASRSRDVDG